MCFPWSKVNSMKHVDNDKIYAAELVKLMRSGESGEVADPTPPCASGQHVYEFVPRFSVMGMGMGICIHCCSRRVIMR